MPSVTLTPRLIYKEDLATSSVRGASEDVSVLGAGTTTLNKVDAIFLSDLTAALDDAAARDAGVGLGELYYNTATGKPKARLT